MKKIISLLTILILISGCSKKEKEVKTIKEPEIIKEETPTYKDDNPVKIAFYEDNKILKEYSTILKPETDINVFSVLLTNDEQVNGNNYKTLFNNFYNQYENKEKYKIGYYIKFYVEDKLIEKTIIDPTSTFALTPYLCIYLYDDIHQPDGAWYSHVEESDVKEDTLYTSIKLFMVEDINKITSPITLEAFTYDSDDDFDENGNYRGNSKYSIEIKAN